MTVPAEPKPIFIGHRKCSSAKNALNPSDNFPLQYKKILSNPFSWVVKVPRERELATLKIDRKTLEFPICIFWHDSWHYGTHEHDGRSRGSIYVSMTTINFTPTKNQNNDARVQLERELLTPAKLPAS